MIKVSPRAVPSGADRTANMFELSARPFHTRASSGWRDCRLASGSISHGTAARCTHALCHHGAGTSASTSESEMPIM